MRIRRCACVLLEPREHLDLDLAKLFAGDSALVAKIDVYALAGHLHAPVGLDRMGADLLMRLPRSEWQDLESSGLAAHPAALQMLLQTGLVLDEADSTSPQRLADDQVRATYWHPWSAVYHAMARWQGVDTRADPHLQGIRTIADLVRIYGPPPDPAFVPAQSGGDPLPLPVAHDGALAALSRDRYTCRNFDPAAWLDLSALAQVLQLSVGAQAAVEVVPGATVWKKSVPSGGSLHPLECFVLVQRVSGLAAGLYHYQPLAHALQPMRSLAAADARELAQTAVAGQMWFVEAPVMVFLLARFQRNFWKYRSHAKALRAIHLDAGHISQMVYLAATELGLGAFITAAINELDICAALGVHDLELGPVAVLGFGDADPAGSTIELRPSLES